jgi:hypothetical protein
MHQFVPQVLKRHKPLSSAFIKAQFFPENEVRPLFDFPIKTEMRFFLRSEEIRSAACAYAGSLMRTRK